MRTDRWERIGAASGIGLVAAIVVGQVIVPQPPKLADLAGFTSYIADHHRALLTQIYLGGLATVFALWFFGTLRGALRRAEGGEGRVSGIAYGGALVAIAIVTVSSAFGGALLLRTQEAGSTRAFLDVYTFGFTLFFFPLATAIAATSLVSWRTGVLPRWHAITGGVFALAMVGGTASIYGSTGYFSLNEPTGVGLVMTLLFGVWTLATSVLLMVGEAEAEQVSEEGATIYHWHLRRAAGQ